MIIRDRYKIKNNDNSKTEEKAIIIIIHGLMDSRYAFSWTQTVGAQLSHRMRFCWRWFRLAPAFGPGGLPVGALWSPAGRRRCSRASEPEPPRARNPPRRSASSAACCSSAPGPSLQFHHQQPSLSKLGSNVFGRFLTVPRLPQTLKVLTEAGTVGLKCG